ncbi:MAG TPA: 1-phosphofructokinase family hexose kinase, partial [Longimicrobiaceae bacterium]|nr:1-phosphofructokinase family hexose kinase [Longimicrobiaceae bacterium]
GLRAAATGFLGRDNAAPFEALFARAGIADAFVRIPGATRMGIKVVDPAGRQTTDVNFPGPAPEPWEVQALLETVAELAAGEPRPWFVLAGSLPPGVEPTLYGGLARTLRAAGCTVVVDASGEPLRHALDAAPHVVKPNVHELEALVGEPLPTPEAVARAARALLARGVELAVVSMGEEGALFARQGATVLARPPRVEVRSTVGAGDAMVAGIVAGRLRGLPLPELARMATAFSLDALTRDPSAGASSGAVEAWAAHVEVLETG